MSNRDIDTLKDGLLQTISTSDTISQFMEKCNNNFSIIAKWGGGPDGAKGDDGDPGVPTKPKVPIHVWEKGKDYIDESGSLNEGYEIEGYEDDELTDVKYQEGHLIILDNAHVYILETDNNNLKPKYILALHSYNSGDIVNGNPGYVHFAYANSPDGIDGFITDDDIRNNNSYGNEPVSTFSLRRSSNNISAIDMPYMGVYSDNTNASSSNPNKYTWIRVQGAVGATGPKGDQGEKGDMGDKGDGYTGHPYTIDLEGDLSTISIGINGTRLYDNDYCECKLHAYYGDENVSLNPSQVSINLPEEYKSLGDGNIVLKSNESKVGQILKRVDGKNSIIQFTPDKDFVFPKKTITFTIHVNATIDDKDDGNTYTFDRDTVWMIKGISSTFELEIQPQYRTIKLFEDGKYYPEKLLVNVYKVEDGERTLFDFSQNTDFQLLYKNYNDNSWILYPNEGVDTKNVSCLEFKIIRYPDSNEPEMWDYEDVWVVADGKSSHYYHADLGSTESMMVLTTGDKINIGTDDEPIYCADIRSESGYSITFEPKFYDGADELEVTDVSIGANSGEEYYANGTFERELTEIEIDGITKYTFTITKIPFGVEVIPMNFVVNAKLTSDDGSEYKSDTISFNVYISTLSNIYTLIPSVSSYNTSTGKTGDTIGCDVYKNNILIETADLDENGLQLKYVVHDENTESGQVINYTEPLVYGHDDDNVKDEFTASDVAIEFILYYRNKGIAKSTVPLIKDGIDGKDGDSWQYIFCRSALYPFDKTGISDPSKWTDNNPTDSNNELLGDNGVVDDNWYDDHKGVDSEYRYEYQSYRKWDKNNKCWGKYGTPTLYSNFSESGSGYSVLLSNPVSVIPVGDDDWSVNENNKNQEDSTLVYLYNNTSDMSKDPNVTITLPENPHFEATKEDGVNKVIFRPVVNNEAFDFVSNSQYKLPITLTYSLSNDDSNVDNFTTTINWSLTPSKGLSDVEVFVDKRVVNTSISNNHSLKVGYYLISSNGNKKFIDSVENNTKGYKIILTDDIEDLSSNDAIILSDWKNATYNFIKNGENRNCYVVLVESDGTTVIDYINVTSVNNGADGASSIHLELTQDYISVPCSADGSGVHPDYESNIHSQMKLYNGDKLIENNITYSFKVNDVISTDITSSNGEFNIPTNLISGDTNIECIATYNGVDFHKILTIDLKETPYELELNKSMLTRDVNNGNKIIDKNIAVRVKYWMGGKWVYTPDGIVKANTTNGQENIQFGSASGENHVRLLIIENSPLASNINDTEVRISYYNGSDVELSYETIGIINNGKNGNAPSCTSTKILGYSLNESEDIDIGTWVPLAELGTLNPGNPIYILNEYVWSDGTTTKVKSVTLAGTQGVDGKSRVLFYLGSFDNRDGKTPTLEGDSVIGLLNDERCDYYVDKFGYAWMRSGNDVEATGSSSGNLNDTNWKASEKVGFLQAGAITADMINTKSIISDTAFISNLTAKQIETDEFKAIKISADQIEGGKINANLIDAGSITADKIAADAITGKTIKSDINISESDMDATWQINNDGGGWLAKKNISWNSDGSGNILNTLCWDTSENVNLSGTLKISGNGDNEVALLNGSSNISDSKHGKLIIAGGIPESETETYDLNKLANNANTRIYDDGFLYSKKAFFEGIETNSLRRRVGFIDPYLHPDPEPWWIEEFDAYNGKYNSPDDIILDYNGQSPKKNNFGYYQSGLTLSWQTTPDLTWDISQIGRTRTFISHKHNNGFCNSRATLYTPDNTNEEYIIDGDGTKPPYFYYDGLAAKALRICPGDCYTLYGYGYYTNKERTSGEFMGWVVTSRTSLFGNYSKFCEGGMFAGFRPRTIVNTDTSYTLNEFDHTIIISVQNRTVTIKTPAVPQEGQIYEIYVCHHNIVLNINFNGKNAYSFIEGKDITSDKFNSDNNYQYRRHITLIYADGQWWENYRNLY